MRFALLNNPMKKLQERLMFLGYKDIEMNGKFDMMT